MTREEQIKWLRRLLKSREDPRGDTEIDVALKCAIKALEAESESRMSYVQEAVNAIMNTCDTDSIKDKAMRNAAKFVQNAIDGSYPDFEELNQEPCEEFVSREQLEREIHAQIAVDAISIETGSDMLEHLPPISPQLKMGKWIRYDNDYESFWKCSKCNTRSYVKLKYCPNCGAKMQEVEE